MKNKSTEARWTKTFYSVLYIFFALILLLQGNSQYVYLTDNALWLLAFGVLFVIIFFSKKGVITRSRIVFSIAACALPLFWHFVWIVSFQERRVHCIAAYTLPVMLSLILLTMSMIDYEVIINIYAEIMTFVALMAVVCWFAFQVLKIMEPTHWVETGWPSYPIQSWFNIHFISQSALRNTSIFVEAPMFVFHLVIALVWLVWHKKAYLKAVVVSAALLSTFSATAYILLITIWISKRVYKLWGKFIKIAFWTLIWAAVCIAIVLYKKWDPTNSRSFETRMEHLHTAIAVEIETQPNEVNSESEQSTNLANQQVILAKVKKIALGSGFNSIITSSTGWGLMLQEQGIWMLGLNMIAYALMAYQAMRSRRWDIFIFDEIIVLLLLVVSANTWLLTYFLFAVAWVYGFTPVIKKLSTMFMKKEVNNE